MALLALSDKIILLLPPSVDKSLDELVEMARKDECKTEEEIIEYINAYAKEA